MIKPASNGSDLWWTSIRNRRFHELLEELDATLKYMSSHVYSEIRQAMDSKDEEALDKHFKARYGELATPEQMRKRYAAIDEMLLTQSPRAAAPFRAADDIYAVFTGPPRRTVRRPRCHPLLRRQPRRAERRWAQVAGARLR